MYDTICKPFKYQIYKPCLMVKKLWDTNFSLCANFLLVIRLVKCLTITHWIALPETPSASSSQKIEIRGRDM